MSLLSLIFGEKKKTTAAIAKERLGLIITHEGGKSGQPGIDLKALQQELLDVISKYVHISKEDIKVELEKNANLEVLEVSITIPEAQPKTA
ncbi:MAG: cell division topological specificity factor MinE [Rhodocyclaceae bacterium]|nr:cell division topological specificity factor MinE [Rhodocyclaceae bacterium]